MTENEIRKTWNQAAERIMQPTPQQFGEMYRKKKETALERLAARYKRFAIFGAIMIPVALAWTFSHILTCDEDMKWTLRFTMLAYFGACSGLDFWLFKGVSSIDCYTMTVSEVSKKALHYRKRHLQSMVFLLPYAFLMVGLLAYCFKAEIYMIYGIVAGAIVGVIMGLRQLDAFMAEYRTITRD